MSVIFDEIKKYGKTMIELKQPPFTLTTGTTIFREYQPNGPRTLHKKNDIVILEINEFWLTRWFQIKGE